MIKVVPYDPKWVEQYKTLKCKLNIIIGKQPHHIEHIGSTSVPGLPAKPIVDIMLGLERNAFEDTIKNKGVSLQLEAAGYKKANIRNAPSRQIFLGFYPDLRCTIHIVLMDGELWHRMLLFRDWLRSNNEVAQEYGELKIRLASQFYDNLGLYRKGKNPFINSLEKKALEKQRTNNPTLMPLSFVSIDEFTYDDHGGISTGTGTPYWGPDGWINEGGGHWEQLTPMAEETWTYVLEGDNNRVDTWSDADGWHVRGEQE